jgi:mannose PTS system EIID component
MVEKTMQKIKFGTLLAIALRSFFLQACWNFQRMQNLGFAFSISPLIRVLSKNREQEVHLLKRHLEFFNTHPYCASIILGVVCHTEEELAQAGERHTDSANRLKVGMMGPLAALGDTVFWAMLKPATAMLGVGIVFLAGEQTSLAVLGPCVFLLMFSIPHVGLQLGGVFLGYHRGIEIVKDLRRFNPQLIAQRLGVFITVLLGGLLALITFQTSTVLVSTQLLGTGILLAMVLVFFFALRRGIGVAYLFYGTTAIAIGLAYAGVL